MFLKACSNICGWLLLPRMNDNEKTPYAEVLSSYSEFEIRAKPRLGISFASYSLALTACVQLSQVIVTMGTASCIRRALTLPLGEWLAFWSAVPRMPNYGFSDAAGMKLPSGANYPSERQL